MHRNICNTNRIQKKEIIKNHSKIKINLIRLIQAFKHPSDSTSNLNVSQNKRKRINIIDSDFNVSTQDLGSISNACVSSKMLNISSSTSSINNF